MAKLMWDLTARTDDANFAFVPPKDAKKIPWNETAVASARQARHDARISGDHSYAEAQSATERRGHHLGDRGVCLFLSPLRQASRCSGAVAAAVGGGGVAVVDVAAVAGCAAARRAADWRRWRAERRLSASTARAVASAAAGAR